jgi:hypothetical protein
MLQPDTTQHAVLMRTDASKAIQHPNRILQVRHTTDPVSIPYEVITFTLLKFYHRVGNKIVNHAVKIFNVAPKWGQALWSRGQNSWLRNGDVL